jgi:hypothetical protein
MWAELSCVQEVGVIMASKCVLQQVHVQVNLLNKSVSVQNFVIPVRKYEYGLASSNIKVFQMCPAVLQMRQVDVRTWPTPYLL